MNHLYVNGDSYSAKENAQPNPYADFLAEKWNVPVVNQARPGSNNDRICRATVQYIESLDLSKQKPFVIIGWGFINRREVWYYGTKKQFENRIPDKEMHLGEYNRLVTLDWLLPNDATYEQKCLIASASVEKQVIDFYMQVFFLADYLAARQIDYLFFSGADNTDLVQKIYPMSVTERVHANEKIYQLDKFCIRDYALARDPQCNPVTGHLSIDGHRMFANFLEEII